MEEPQNTWILAIDENLAPRISMQEAEDMKALQKKFIGSYLKHKDTLSIEDWLQSEMQESLPESSPEQIAQMRDEIIGTIQIQEEKKVSLEKAISNGRSKEFWFASEMKAAISCMSAHEASSYLQELDGALETANESLYRTIRTQAGGVSQNPNLDGFIAEQYHVQTFNLNAEASGSRYRARVLEPDGTAYVKNSVDIVIEDDFGKIVRRYQSKYGKTASATEQAFEHGDYRGQQKLVPQGQEQAITKKVTTAIEAPDGTTSTPLSKERAKELQQEAQSGKWNELNWNEYKAKDIAIGIGKEVGQSALMGAAVGSGFYIAQKVWNGEEIEGDELVETALMSGADFGVKAAAAGALKVGAEKGLISAIPKGTPASTLTNVAFVAVENAKILVKMATGELDVREGLCKMEQTTVSTVAGIATGAKGSAIGAAVGSVLGPVGTVIGGFVGGTVGYMAGSKVGETVVKAAQSIGRTVGEVARTVVSTAVDVVETVASGISAFCGGLVSLLGF